MKYTNIITKFKNYITAMPLYTRNILRLQQSSKLFKVYYFNLTKREQILVGIMLSFVLTLLLMLVVNNFSNLMIRAQQEHMILQSQKFEASNINKNYKNLLNLSANEFNIIKIDKIKEDITQILKINNPDIAKQDDLLTIKLNNITFESALLFLDQLRKSYGLFPTSMSMINLPSPSYINFTVNFRIDNND